MVNDNQQIKAIPQKAGVRGKSLLCRTILYSAFTYFLILALLFLTGTIFSGRITSFIDYYYQQQDDSAEYFIFVALIGTLLYLMAATGIIMMIYQRKAGFYIFFFASLALLGLDLYYLIFDWLRYLIHTGYLFILGIVHFSGKCYKQKGT